MSGGYFKCDKDKCFGNNNGLCVILLAPCGKRSCPFAKTEARLAAENLKAVERLISINRDDLADTYNSTRFV